MKSFGAAALALLAVLVISGRAHAFKEGGQNCAACHTLSEKEAVAILEKVNMAGARVLSISMSPIKGLWEADIEYKGRRLVIYVDFARKFVSPGPFIEYATRKDITRERAEALNRGRRIDTRGLSLAEALVLGNATAPVKVIVFTDPACVYCARLHAEIKAVVARRPDIVFYLKLFALVSRDPKAATSIVCARSLPMLEDAYEKKPVPERPCPTKEVEHNMKFAEEQGLDGAPVLIFPDGTLNLGFLDAAALEKRIDEAAGSAGRSPLPSS